MRALVLASMLCLIPALAGAQAAKQKEAEQHFVLGQKAYNGAQYDVAVKEFLQAYTLVPLNTLLFNIGQAYRMSGDPERALSYYEKYVAFEPGGGQVAEAKEHINNLKVQVEDARRERDRMDADQRAKADEEKRKRDEEARKLADADLAKKRAEARSAGSGLRTGGLIVGGIGVVGLGVGVALGAKNGFDGKALAITGVGAAALIGGGVMYFLGVKKRSDAEAAIEKTAFIVPTVTSDTVGVTWISTF